MHRETFLRLPAASLISPSVQVLKEDIARVRTQFHGSKLGLHPCVPCHPQVASTVADRQRQLRCHLPL